MSSDDVLLEDRPAAGVLRLRLNRPSVKNALNRELRTALADRFTAADKDNEIRSVILAGSPSAFAAGADLNEFVTLGPIDLHQLGYHLLWRALADFRKPIVAAVRGYALGGGCELALHSDLLIAGDTAKFGLPEVRLGIMPGAGGTQRLVRVIGKFLTMRLVATGEIVPAKLWSDWGLASYLVPDDEVETLAVELASKLAESPPLSLEFVKEALVEGADLPLSSALVMERKSMHLLFDTVEKSERMRAFLDSRNSKSG